MKRFTLYLTSLSILCVSAISQVKDTTIQTRILIYPVIQASIINPADLKFEYAASSAALTGTAASTKTGRANNCIPAGYSGIEALKRATNLDVYVKKIEFISPVAYLRVSDAKAAVVYSEQISKGGKETRVYGDGRCEHANPNMLEQNFTKERAAFEKDIVDALNASVPNAAKSAVEANIFFTWQTMLFELNTAKDKDFDYTAIQRAFDLASGAYARISSAGYSVKDLDDLKTCISIWEAELKESNLNDRKARINEKVTAALHYNIAVASLYIGLPDAAINQIGKCITIRGDRGTQGRMPSDIRNKAIQLKKNMDINKDIASVPASLIPVVSKSTAASAKITLITKPASELPAFEKDFKTVSPAKQAGQMDLASMIANAQAGKGAAPAEAAPGTSRYESKVTKTALQGYMLMLNAFMDGNITSFSDEICSLTQLNQIDIRFNKIASISPSIGNMKYLKVLKLAKNEITALPEEIGNCDSLEDLDVSDNKLTSLPASMAAMKNLKVLNIKGNAIPQQAIDKLLAAKPALKIKK